MPVLLALVAAAAGVLVWIYRARAAAEVAHELADVAADVMAAARRFGFARRRNLHPVDSVERVDVAIGGLALAFLELDGLPDANQKRAAQEAMAATFDLLGKDAEEIMILGHWLVTQCNGPQMAIERLSKRLFQIGGTASLAPLMEVLNAIGNAGGGTLSPRQKDALADIARHMRVR